MSSSVSWLPDNANIILAVFNDSASPRDFVEQFDTIKAMLDTVNYPVYVCHDLSRVARVGRIELKEYQRVVRHSVITHPNRAFSYFIGASRSAEVVIDLAKKVFPATVQRLMLVDTLNDALQDIHRRSTSSAL
jgi:hypothetical protein